MAGAEFVTRRVDRGVTAEVLARHVGRSVEALLDLVGDEHRVEVTNQLLDLAAELVPASRDGLDHVGSGPVELHEVTPPPTAGIRYLRPQVPLGRTDLLINARGEPSLAHEISAELTSADHVDLLCAFVKWYGLRLLVEQIEELGRRGVQMRVITTTYVGATERRAVDELVRLGAQVKVSYETQRTRLHAKAWLFRRNSGMDTAYVGSSNLSRAALIDGLEWNVRLSRTENAAVLDKFAATFDSYWQDPSFESYEPERDGDRLDQALGSAFRREPLRLSGLEVRPFSYQQEILDQLEAERQVHDRWHNLVVAATGTGKTVIAAMDYKRLRVPLGGNPSLLFVAHRKEILDQSLAVFAQVLGDPSFGELYVAGERPDRWRHVFASIQSLTAGGIDRIPPDHFDVVIVDEFHHAEAATYQRLLEHVQPKVLLGLTATPERADGQDVTRWFGGHIAAELRLWEALERELLCPFHYFGIADGTDLARVEWRRGGYDQAHLERIFTGNDARARLVLRQVAEKLPDARRMRALGFCVSKAHAAYMTRVFNEAGLPAAAVDADTPMHQRQDSRRQLANGDLRAIFSVDVFNEGLDVSDIDTVLFLRPTESATVFLQQLGRGLRNAPDKACLTVLDFIGNQHRRFRFDVRYRALTGASRRGLEHQIQEGFPFLPSGCSMELDRVATRIVLDNVRQQLRLNTRQLVSDVQSYGDVDLATYLAESGRELVDVYRAGGSWTRLRRAAGLPTAAAGPDDEALLKRAHRFARVDDKERGETWRRWLSAEGPPDLDTAPPRQKRLADMLFFSLWPSGGGFASIRAGLERLWEHPALCAEAVELLDLAIDAIRHLPVPLVPEFVDVPLWVHASYSREELLAGMGHATLARTPSSDMQGVRFVEPLRTDVFTFTLQKAEADYSPTTMYKDYAMAPDLVHWESQSTTSDTSPTGRRYLTHRESGTHVFLFARQTSDDEIGARPYVFLGPASYVSHTGSRPIAITWRLDHPMPADFYAQARILAG
ncbi:MAG: DUF3427 domain-containing protein [Actinobacteria bacterium]|nr:DUF3427 domain-containing protein [Actinomycetota bacterium]